MDPGSSGVQAIKQPPANETDDLDETFKALRRCPKGIREGLFLQLLGTTAGTFRCSSFLRSVINILTKKQKSPQKRNWIGKSR